MVVCVVRLSLVLQTNETWYQENRNQAGQALTFQQRGPIIGARGRRPPARQMGDITTYPLSNYSKCYVLYFLCWNYLTPQGQNYTQKDNSIHCKHFNAMLTSTSTMTAVTYCCSLLLPPHSVTTSSAGHHAGRHHLCVFPTRRLRLFYQPTRAGRVGHP